MAQLKKRGPTPEDIRMEVDALVGALAAGSGGFHYAGGDQKVLDQGLFDLHPLPWYVGMATESMAQVHDAEHKPIGLFRGLLTAGSSARMMVAGINGMWKALCHPEQEKVRG